MYEDREGLCSDGNFLTPKVSFDEGDKDSDGGKKGACHYSTINLFRQEKEFFSVVLKFMIFFLFQRNKRHRTRFIMRYI